MKTKKSFFTIIFFSLSFSVFTNGKQEGDYAGASKLLKEKKQSQAIGEIITTLEKTPQSFNRAAELFEKAMSAQNSFEKQFSSLLEQLYKDPDDSEKILVMIFELESLNIDLDPSVISFLNNLKTSTTYAVNRIRFNRIMDEGIALIKKGLYFEAANKFSEGYSIYYKSFENAYKGSSRLSQTEKAIAEVYAEIEKFKTEEKKFLNAVSSYRNSLRYTKTTVNQNTVNNLIARVEKMRELNTAVFNSGNILKAFYLQDVKNGNNQPESFLPFAFRFTLGRTNAKEFEGISGAFEAGLLNRLNILKSNILDLIHENMKKANAEFNFVNKTDISENIRMMELCITEMNRIVNLSEAPKNINVRFPENQNNNRIAIEYAAALTENIKNTRTFYENYIELSKYNYSSEKYEPDLNYIRNPNDPEIILTVKDIETLKTLDGKIKNLQENLEPLKNSDFKEEQLTLSKIHKDLLQNIDMLYIKRYEYYTKIKNDAGLLAVAENEKDFKKITEISYGTKKEDGNIVYYPSKVVDLLNKSNKNLKTDIADLGKSIENISSCGIDFKRNFFLKSGLDSIKSSESKLKKIQTALDSLSVKARNDLLKVDLAKREADFRYNEAVRSVNEKDFTAAREHISISRDKSNDALRLEEESAYRKFTDERLESLGKEINRLENEIVVRDVRRYIDEAKKMYFSGNFDIAKNTLMTAKRRWHITNLEENEEIDTWLSITQTVEIMKTGRSIPQAAPLYPQMTQLLNNAKQLYNEADKKLKLGQREAALDDLNSARENIKQVLLIYPINEESGLLNLKIDRLIDPVNFNSQLTKRINKLKREYKNNPQNSYGELLDLYTLDKNFPGIAALKEEVEIYLGIKIIPPDTRALKKSQEYTESARKIYASGDRRKFQEAIEKLDEAIKLDGNNYEAVVMKDRIYIALGGNALTVLNAANEEKYRQAVLELQKGNKLTAFSLVEQLLQDPEGKKSAKVHDLKTRIDSQL